MEGISFDFTNLFSPVLKGGLTKKDINSYKEKASEAVENILNSNPGFMGVPFESKWLESVRELKEWILSFESLVVLGIGGSALGNIALQSALNPADYNNQKNRKTPRIYIVDNVDPDLLSSVLDQIDIKTTLFNVISKSGTTAEAMANYMVARGLLKTNGLKVQDHILFTTDPQNGILRKMSRDENIRAIEIPPQVGGRFSVLTPVGLVSAMAGGIDIQELFLGARDMCEKCKNKDIWKNPAALNAVIHYLYYLKGYNLSVMMVYSNRLYLLADWYRQIWAESIGKKLNLKKETVNVGQTPVKALGATDQHSQVQLYNEGPKDKIITLIKLENFEREVSIPKIHEDIAELKYLGGRKLSELLNTELAGTEYALLEHERPNMRVTFPRISAYNIGEFIFMYEFSTAVMGGLLQVDPYDQPGVELGKKVTYALMGREGYEDLAAEVMKKIQVKNRVIM